MTDGTNCRLDARVSVAVFVAIGAAALFAVTTTAAMLGLLAYVALLYLAVGRRPFAASRTAKRARRGCRVLGRHLLRLAPVVAVIVALNGVLVPGEAILSFGAYTVLTQEGTASGVFFSLRLVVLYFGMLLFVAVTPPVEFARAVHSLLRPVSRKLAARAAFHGFLILSFVPLFEEEIVRIRQAQSFRGADLKSGGIARRSAAARALIVPLVLSAIHRSSQLAAVIELRGLRDRVGTLLPARRPGVADVVVAAATAGVLVTLALWSAGAGT